MKVGYGEKNYNSILVPFFQQNRDTDYTPSIEESISSKEKLSEFCNKYIKLPDDFTEFVSEGVPERETYVADWTIFNLNCMLDRYVSLLKNNIYTLDIGFKYVGLGYIKICFYDPKLDAFFFRLDGGTNGWDRESNFEKVKNYKSNYSKDVYGFTFTSFLNQAYGNEKEKPYGY